MRLRIALVLAVVAVLPAAALAIGPESLPAWYKISRTVNWTPDPCTVGRTGDYGGQILVTFPYDAGADMNEGTAGDNPFDCYALDTGDLPDTASLASLRPVNVSRGCPNATGQLPPTLIDFCGGGNVVDPVTGFRVHYFNLPETPGNQFFILTTSVSGFKGSLGSALNADGSSTERSSTSGAAKNVGYDYCRDIGYDGKVIGKCGPAFAPNGSLPNQFGGQTALSDYRNPQICPGPGCKKTILFTLSAEWCPPCQAEAQNAQDFFQDYAARGHQSIELLIENNAGDPANTDPALPSRWASRWGLTFPIVGDINYGTWQQYNNQGYLPSHVMLNDSGKIFFRNFGYNPPDGNPCTCPFSSSLDQSVDCEMRCQVEANL